MVMEISDLNWGWFVSTCLAIGAIRLLFRQVLPLKLLSVTTASTVGFGFFLVLPILGYSNLLAIPLREYSVLVGLAYFSFLVGASVARQLLGEHKFSELVSSPDVVQTNFAAAFCILWLTILLIEFFKKGGFVHMTDVIFGGWAHMQVLAQIGELMQYNQGLSFLAITRILLTNIFWCLWVILYIKMPKRALVVWMIYILTNLGDYIARSTLLELVLVPLFAYVVVN